MDTGLRNTSDCRKPDRRRFLEQLACLTALTGLPSLRAATRPAYFTVINHIHQAGIGLLFHHGLLRGKRYDDAYSIFYGLQQTMDALEKWRSLVICLDFDSYAYEAANAEDPAFIRDVRKRYVESGRIDIVGGSYGQPYFEVGGWESNVRQLVEGRAVIKKLFDKQVDCFICEEIAFHPQMPQLLKLCGYRYASLEIQNSGQVRKINKAIVNWRGLDGTEIPSIPQNDLMIPVPKQYQAFDAEIARSADFEEPLITLWVEIWPPGGDWGASVQPYEKGLRSFEQAGIQPSGLNEYMRRRCGSRSDFDSEYLSMDDAKFQFDVWAGLGGWGYQGDWLLRSQRSLEHSLRAAELLVSLRPDDGQYKKLRELWKKLMISQNHDMVIVSGFPAEYDNVRATNLEAARMIHREVQSGIAEMRKSLYDALAGGKGAVPADYLLVQNATAQAGAQPVVFEYAVPPAAGCALFDGNKEIPAQRVTTTPTNVKPQFAALLPLAPYSVRSFRIAKAGGAPSRPKSSGEAANEFYRVRWDSGASAFAVDDRELGCKFLFRPFAGEIKRVKETFWESPNPGDSFRAKDFNQVSFVPDVEEDGPVYSALQVKGNILTLATTPDPAAWVTARAVVYPGIKRVDFFSELNTNLQMGFRAFAELEVDGSYAGVYRDFPFGEEQSHNGDFSALHYVRLQSPERSLVIAHDGSQHFFAEKRGDGLVLRNVMARETLMGCDYRWRWSVASRESLGPAESLLFAQALSPAVVDVSARPAADSGSLVTTADASTVIFHLSKGHEKTTIWLVNYSSAKRQAVLNFSHAYASVRRTDFADNPAGGPPAALAKGGRQVRLELHEWEMAALELLK